MNGLKRGFIMNILKRGQSLGLIESQNLLRSIHRVNMAHKNKPLKAKRLSNQFNYLPTGWDNLKNINDVNHFFQANKRVLFKYSNGVKVLKNFINQNSGIKQMNNLSTNMQEKRNDHLQWLKHIYYSNH